MASMNGPPPDGAINWSSFPALSGAFFGQHSIYDVASLNCSGTNFIPQGNGSMIAQLNCDVTGNFNVSCTNNKTNLTGDLELLSNAPTAAGDIKCHSVTLQNLGTITGAASITTSALTVSGNASITGAVTGPTSLAASLLTTSALSVVGNATITGVVSGPISLSASALTTSALTVSGDASITGAVTGPTSLSASALTTSALTVSGNASITGAVTGPTSITTGALTVTGNVTAANLPLVTSVTLVTTNSNIVIPTNFATYKICEIKFRGMVTAPNANIYVYGLMGGAVHQTITEPLEITDKSIGVSIKSNVGYFCLNTDNTTPIVATITIYKAILGYRNVFKTEGSYSSYTAPIGCAQFHTAGVINSSLNSFDNIRIFSSTGWIAGTTYTSICYN